MPSSQGGGGGMDYSGYVSAFSNATDKRDEGDYGRNQSAVNMGEGDVSVLKKILEDMTASTSSEGIQALFQQIFKQGFEKDMPGIISGTNTAGVRPQDSTTANLLQNDLLARLTGQAVSALGEQQKNTAQAASSYASLTEKPIVTELTGQGAITGGKPSGVATIGRALGLWS